MSFDINSVYKDLSTDKFIILNGYESGYEVVINWTTGTANSVDIPRDNEKHAQIKKWCIDNCSEVVIYVFGGYGSSKVDRVYFFNEEDAVAFKLKWI